MSKKSEFINYVRALRAVASDEVLFPEEAQAYWEALCNGEETEKPMFTDNGKLILQFLKDNQTTPLWKARDIAEGLFISSRGVSGAMRKLVSDGFVEKVGQDPVVYALTELGKTIVID